MFSRIARMVAVSLPLLLVGVFVYAGHWRLHDGRVERVKEVVVPASPGVVDPQLQPTDQTTLLHHLSPSVPWPVWAALVLLCVLPAVASMFAWSGARRARETRFSTSSA